MTVYNYIRVSTEEQNNERQFLEFEERFGKNDGSITLTEKGSAGKGSPRPVFQKMMEQLKCGDIIRCVSLDRFSRSASEMLRDAEQIIEIGAELQILKEGLTLSGRAENHLVTKLLMTIMGAVAEMERTVMLERQSKAISAIRMGLQKDKRKKGKYLTYSRINAILDAVKNEGLSTRKAGARFGVSNATVSRIVAKYNANESARQELAEKARIESLMEKRI